ncbi:NUDIX domain-containing protein [Anaeromicrobium sediminis]|uniref:NUDIX hydrolase n=1 Tax=Anaeromicrobium sediminis TaxID=1478221 RepID=A0A267MEY2_9FIRM|nr:NUDIX hydrolase [Anaeromicrobium sediminis]PAB58141.1 NUDIX hydrolase [Anaeromicrobium sediminis]
MREEVSSGGVVIFGNAILLLKKYNGDWVLPKGKIKKNESRSEAAIREVYEEGRVKAEIMDYIDKIKYSFKNCWNEYEVVEKTVHWYLMKTKSMNCAPLKEEGFIEARFVHVNRALGMVKYDDERYIIKKVLDKINREKLS